MRTSKIAKVAVLFTMAALFSGTASADQVADELLKLGEETTILKAKAKRLEAQGQVTAMQKQLEQKSGAEASGVPAASAAFAVQAIEGIGKTLYATILLENGSTRDVKEGDVLEKGLRIISIGSSEVIYKLGKGRPATVRVNPAITYSDLVRSSEQPFAGKVSAVRFPSLPPVAVQPFQATPSGLSTVAPSRSVAEPSRR